MKGEIHASPFDHWGCIIFKGAFFVYFLFSTHDFSENEDCAINFNTFHYS